MQFLKLKQFGLVLCCLVSLFMPSIAAACTCRHAGVATAHCDSEPRSSQETSSCEHHRHHEDKTAADSSETIQYVSSLPDCCCCASLSTPRAFAKADTVKIEKQIALSVEPTRIKFDSTTQNISIKTVVFAAPLYLSDSFYNISPGRAPPRA